MSAAEPSLADLVRDLGDEGPALLDAAGLDAAMLERCWGFWARPAQRPPQGDWSIWLLMAGRGFGKTRAGAEWVRAQALANPGCRIALVGATIAEARRVMVEGVSGLLATAHAADELIWAPATGRLMWGNRSQAQLFTAADPEGLRGPEHHFAWADEIGKWTGGEKAWDNLMLGLRRGERPRACATTTPRATALLRRLARDPAVALTRGRTRDNRANLSASFMAHMTAQYAGTRFGRQELDGELIEDVEGALWTRATIEGARGFGSIGDGRLARIVVAVDPPASAEGDACGIVAAGLGRDGLGYVLEDASVEQAPPERWAQAVNDCARRWGADRVIAESNNGGEMVRSVLRAHDASLPVALVHASRAKAARAEPVALLYQQGRVKHAAPFAALEDQLCGMTIGGGYEGPGRSPDRADALVWALTELMLKPMRAEPRVMLL